MARSPRFDHRRTARRHRRAAVGVRLLALIALVGGVLAGTGEVARADEVGATTVTIGESNGDAQRQVLLEYFGVEPDVPIIEVTVDETRQAMVGMFEESISSAYSSTALTCRELGDGLDVTTRNINVVSPAIYALALVTAGIGDAKLVVAAPTDAPAQGMTALTGVFKTWDSAPCASGASNPARKRLALEQLTLTAGIGKELVAAGMPDGIQRASNAVLETQKTIINDGLVDPSAIDEALAAQERTQDITISAERRNQLLDVFQRMARSSIDWSTFAKGWEIDYAGANRITMRGEGIAVRQAQASATAEAAAAMTATAQAEQSAALTATAGAASLSSMATAEAESAALTATAEAGVAMTATAVAESAALTATADAQNAALTATAQVQATVDALAAALTATAAPQPTETPVPTPTPGPVTVGGTFAGTRDGHLLVRPRGAAPPPNRPTTEDGVVTFAVAPTASVSREGEAVTLSTLREGDVVRLEITGDTGQVIAVRAEEPPRTLGAIVAGLWWVAAIGLAVPTLVWLWKRLTEEPFLVSPRPVT